MKESLQQHIPFDVDISEGVLLRKYPNAFRTLLLDQTMSMKGEPHNIFWATHDYESLGEGYEYDSPIQIELIARKRGMTIMPRVRKDKKSLPTTEEKIEFSRKRGETCYDYIRQRCLEKTCEEAINLAGCKLRVVKEHTKNTRQWLYWAYEALQNIYGFEWQGDSLLLAREKLLMTFMKYYHDKFDEYPKTNSINKVANIISWNLWQMDGQKDIKCYVMDWKTKIPTRFIDSLEV